MKDAKVLAPIVQSANQSGRPKKTWIIKVFRIHHQGNMIVTKKYEVNLKVTKEFDTMHYEKKPEKFEFIFRRTLFYARF